MAALPHRAFLNRLAAPGADLSLAANRVRRKPELVKALIAGIGGDNARIRFAASRTLRLLSQHAPDSAYPYFDFFALLLAHQNEILKWNAILGLANLAAVDRAGKLERILDVYLAPISGPIMVTAANTMLGAGTIAAAKPHLAAPIAAAILQVEHASYATPECRNVAIGHAIVALGRFFDAIPDRRAAWLFVRRHSTNPRNATRAKAKRFLKRWPMEAAQG